MQVYHKWFSVGSPDAGKIPLLVITTHNTAQGVHSPVAGGPAIRYPIKTMSVLYGTSYAHALKSSRNDRNCNGWLVPEPRNDWLLDRQVNLHWGPGFWPNILCSRRRGTNLKHET
jgi:hypothetical protein